MSTSLDRNIIFMNNINKEMYMESINVCNVDFDIDLLPE
jgi:hypothetical protein